MTGTPPILFFLFFICILGGVPVHVWSKTKRRMDSWFRELAHIKFLLSLFIFCVWASLWGILSVSSISVLAVQQLTFRDHFVAAAGRLLAQHQRLSFPFPLHALQLIDESLIVPWIGRYAEKGKESCDAVSPFLIFFLHFLWAAISGARSAGRPDNVKEN